SGRTGPGRSPPASPGGEGAEPRDDSWPTIQPRASPAGRRALSSRPPASPRCQGVTLGALHVAERLLVRNKAAGARVLQALVEDGVELGPLFFVEIIGGIDEERDLGPFGQRRRLVQDEP